MVEVIKDKQKNVSDRPRRDTSLKVKMNWWILAFFITLGVVVIQNFMFKRYVDLAQVNKEIVYMKLYPNGSWERTIYRRQDNQDFLPATVDMILKNFAKVRFGLYPPTVQHDYGQVGLYISGPLFQQFIAKKELGGFDAVKKVTDILSNVKNQDVITLKDIWIDHYDSVKARYSSNESEVIRTNMYYTKVTHDSQGRLKGQEAKILKMQWRLISKEELEQLANQSDEKVNILDYNPIGVEIVDYDEIDDPAGLNIVQEENTNQ